MQKEVSEFCSSVDVMSILSLLGLHHALASHSKTFFQINWIRNFWIVFSAFPQDNLFVVFVSVRGIKMISSPSPSTGKPNLDFVAVPLNTTTSSSSSSSSGTSTSVPLNLSSAQATAQPNVPSGNNPHTSTSNVSSTISGWTSGVTANLATALLRDRISTFWTNASQTDASFPGSSSSTSYAHTDTTTGAAEDGYFDPNAPLLQELDIDVSDIGKKFSLALVPYSGWRMEDATKLETLIGFWGPLLAVIIFGMCLFQYSFTAVGWVLVVWMFGSICMYVLVKCVGGANPFAQVTAVLGYGTLPLVATLLVQRIWEIGYGSPFSNAWWTFAGVLWATATTLGMLVTEQTRHRAGMLVLPLLLVYSYMVRVTYLQTLWNVKV